MNRRALTTPVLLLAFTMSARAQELPNTTVHIELADGALCTAVKNRATERDDDKSCKYGIWLVHGGMDNSSPACWQKGCEWIATVKGALHATTSFSLRLGPLGRTSCRQSTGTAWNRHVVFTRRGFNTARDIDILRIEPLIPATPTADPDDESRFAAASLAYARDVKVKPEEHDVPCKEGKLIPASVEDVQFDMEYIRLQIFPRKKAQCAPIINELVPLDRKIPEGTEIPLTSQALARTVLRQGIEAKLCYPPGFTSIEPVEESLRQMDRSFQVKVK